VHALCELLRCSSRAGTIVLRVHYTNLQYMHIHVLIYLSILNVTVMLTLWSVCPQVFDEATLLGFRMRILDIGGGFAGGCFDAQGKVQLGQVPLAVNSALATYFPDPTVKVSCQACMARLQQMCVQYRVLCCQHVGWLCRLLVYLASGFGGRACSHAWRQQA